jgi:hypothetical protein
MRRSHRRRDQRGQERPESEYLLLRHRPSHDCRRGNRQRPRRGETKAPWPARPGLYPGQSRPFGFFVRVGMIAQRQKTFASAQMILKLRKLYPARLR